MDIPSYLSKNSSCYVHQDYIPVLSTLTNLVALVTKPAFACYTPTNAHGYCAHLKQKPILRCLGGLIPFVGNALIYAYDHNRIKRFHMQPSEEVHRMQVACAVALGATDDVKGYTQHTLAMQINELQEMITECNQLNAATLISIQNKINKKLSIHRKEMTAIRQYPIEQDVQPHLLETQRYLNILLDTLEAAYQKFLRTLSDMEFLQEAKRRYLLSFPKLEQEEEAKKIQNMTLEQCIPLIRRQIQCSQSPLDERELQLFLNQTSSICTTIV